MVGARLLFLALGLALSASCASTPPANTAAPGATSAPPSASPSPAAATHGDAPSVDFRALAAREVGPLPKRSFALGNVTLETEAAAPPSVKESDDAYSISISAGIEAPIQCFAYKKSIDPAGQVGGVVAGAAETPNLEIKAVGLQDVFVVGSAPAVALEVVYTVPKPGGPALGDLKVVLVAHPRASVLCFHDQLGYMQTLRRITSGLALSCAKAVGDPDRPEVWIGTVGDGHPVGFVRNYVAKDPQGHEALEEAVSTFASQSKTSMAFVDQMTVEVWDAAGYVSKAVKSVGRQGKLESSFELERVGRGAYKLDAETGGKKTSTKYTSKDPAGLWGQRLAESRIARDLLGGKAKEVSYESFDSDDLSSFAMVHATLESAGERKVRMKRGSLELLSTFDKGGHPTRQEGAVNGVAVVYSRVYPAP